MRNLIQVIVAATVLFTAIGQAQAFNSVEVFFKPKFGGDRLDWCLNWGVGCGKPAADAFCINKGFKKSANFSKANNIGNFARTRLISTGAVCDQGFCDGFKKITCTKPAPVAKTFFKPKFQGNRLDWCVNWATGCGKPAADKYCQIKGFNKSINFKKANNIGQSKPTRLIGTGAVCDQGFCDGFKRIRCGM
jgi:hypothetical protein